MDEPTLRQLLADVRSGVLSADDAVSRLRRLPFADLGFAKVDHHRTLRQGLPEAVYAPGKTAEQCAAIVAELLDADGSSPVLLTRADDDQAAAALDRNPGGVRTGRTVAWRSRLPRPGKVLVLTAGTSDLPVAEECVATLTAHGLAPTLNPDVGVAGVHRLLATADDLATAALIDAGADVGEIRTMLGRLPMAGWSLEVEPVMRGGIGATQVHVVVAETAVVRTYAHITGLVDEARLPDRVRTRAQATFAALAEAEGHLHRRPAAQVHFHEVGGGDAIIDVVGTCAALEVLGVDTVASSAVANGT